MSKIPEISEKELNHLLSTSSQPILIDMFTQWCVPCKRILPSLEAFADKYKEKVQIVRVDVDMYPDVALKYRVMSVPTFVIVHQGEIVETLVGASENKLEDMIRRAIS